MGGQNNLENEPFAAGEGEMLEAGEDTKSLQEQVEEQKAKPVLFGTFEGVFVPNLLTILGVIMYLREGWVVGNAGLLGAWLIILISFAITTCTGLSLSSITTNIRIGAGGAFSIISQSLGLEVGGSIGIPLYLSQALAVSMYIFGIRAGWRWFFPEHPALYIDLAAFILLFVIAYISARLAFRIQYFILVVIVASLVSVFWTGFGDSMQGPVQLWGTFPGSPETGFVGIGFWEVFAVYFPAATGIMAGANMSGELKNPRKSIPLGTLSVIGISLCIYLALAYWFARSATPEELVSNYTIIFEKAAFGPIVVAGLLGATFSSALNSIVGAPRILQALGEHGILPKSEWFSQKTDRGEPRNAILFTGAIVLGAIMLRNLNSVAPLITMFFLITYSMINVVVFIEQNLKLVSFRPLFKIPLLVSFLGAAGSLFAMFIINPGFSLLAVVVVLLTHNYLLRKHLKAPFGDVRSGLFVAVAEWAAKKTNSLTSSSERTWKANLLVPVEDSRELMGTFYFLRDITYPKGSVKLLGLAGKTDEENLLSQLSSISEGFQEEGVFSSWTIIDTAEFEENLVVGMEALTGSFFRPSILFLRLPENKDRDEEIREIIRKASMYRMGVLLFSKHPQAGLGRQNLINLWIENRGLDWDISMELGNMDLALLIAYKLKSNWKASLSFMTFAPTTIQARAAENFLQSLAELARIPNVKMQVLRENPIKSSRLPFASLHIFSLDPNPDLDLARRLMEKAGSSCLFALDSGEENALA